MQKLDSSWQKLTKIISAKPTHQQLTEVLGCAVDPGNRIDFWASEMRPEARATSLFHGVFNDRDVST